MNPLSLKLVGVFVGVMLIAAHALAMIFSEPIRAWAKGFPRSRTAGLALLSVDFVWTYVLIYQMDWGEFYYLQTPVMVALPVFLFLVIRYVDDFLAARALGILGLLAAAPVLDAAFLRAPMSRLLVVVLAYVWVVMGMLYVGVPHLLRDQIGWLNRSATHWKTAALAGIVYGAAVLLCAVVWY